MLGHGFYNKHSHEQAKANMYALPLIVEAINRIDLAQIGGEFRIADYGSAQGQNSLLPMKTAIAQIRARAAKSGGTAIPIDVTHTDLPTNDWSTLFQTVLFSPDSYLAGETDVFCFASGTSIYQQIFPPNHIALGYSAITEHWLSRKPCKIPMKSGRCARVGKCATRGRHKRRRTGAHFCSIARWKCNHPLSSSLLAAALTPKATAARKA
jgi:hypothetical protein